MENQLRKGDFAKDDYEEINDEFFDDVLSSGSWAALPAGWHNPYSSAAEGFKTSVLSTLEHQQYALDEGDALKRQI